MKGIVSCLFILTIIGCHSAKQYCDKRKEVEAILDLNLPKECDCVYLYKTDYVSQTLSGPYRYYILIENCNSSDSIIDKLKLIKYSEQALDSNSRIGTFYSNGGLKSIFFNNYSNERLWEFKNEMNRYDSPPGWWVVDSAFTNNYANHYILNDSSLVAPSRLDSTWNGKVVLQNTHGNTFIYIETFN
jgi:hypothetical protein